MTTWVILQQITVMQSLKPGKDNMYAILQYNDFQNLGQYTV